MTGPTFEVFSLFPAAISSFLEFGLIGKALSEGRVAVHCTDFREFTSDRHRTVDDAPYGGGAGMVMKIEPVVAAMEAVEAARGPMHRILVTPSAPRFDQRAAERLARLPRIGVLCGRYEGIDDRVREAYVDECISLGDFVLNGGEVAALAIIEAVARLSDGVLGNPESAVGESFAAVSRGLWLEHPHYTRPPEFRGLRVPDVLLRGDHLEISRWRAVTACQRTWQIRPELRGTRVLGASRPLLLALDLRGAGEISQEDLAVQAARLGLPVLTLGPGSPLRDLKALRRSVRREFCGRAPQILGLSALETAPKILTQAGEVLDRLEILAGDHPDGSSGPLVLLLPCGGKIDPDVDACYAPSKMQAEEAGIELASSLGMIESSQPWPPGGVVYLAAAALVHLRGAPVGPKRVNL